MARIDLDDALTKGKRSSGAVYINQTPQIRSGKRNDFMVGRFLNKDQDVEFKIWEEYIFSPVVENGPGVYEAEVEGSEYNGQTYLTVLKIEKQLDPSITKRDFLDSISQEYILTMWKQIQEELVTLGASADCWALVDQIVNAEEIKGRFMYEAAAISHHDSIIGGLAHHTLKMLRILVAVIKNNDFLLEHIDLLVMGIFLHDIGKIFEYNELEVAPFWYANHRVQGIEYVAKFKDHIIAAYNESFYRQLQSIIIGHHGEYGDRPTTVAAGIIHYIDTLESQSTELIDLEKKSNDSKIYVRDWGYLAGLNY